MKYIFVLIFILSCAHQQKQPSLKKANKYSYLQEFYKIRDELKLETKSCKNYMKTRLNKLMRKTKMGETIKDLSNAASSYTPELFDWHTAAHIKDLYLTYQYSYDIMSEHFEISNHIKECLNDFDNMNFLKAVIRTYKKDKKSAQQIFHKYFSYLNKGEISPLNLLIAANLLTEMEKHQIISFHDKKEFLLKKNKMEQLFSQTGKSSLDHFRKKEYKDIYKLASALQTEKKVFKKYSLNSFSFN